MPDQYKYIGIDSDYVEDALFEAQDRIKEDVDNMNLNEGDYMSNKQHVKEILEMCFYFAHNWNEMPFIEHEVKAFSENKDKWINEIKDAMTKIKKEREAIRYAVNKTKPEAG